MSEENDDRNKIKKVKKKVWDYVKVLDDIENDIDKFHDYTDYQKKLIYEDRRRGTRMANILEEFEKYR